MDITSRVEHLLKRYSEEQILRAIVNSYKALIDTESSDITSIEKSIKTLIDTERSDVATVESSIQALIESETDVATVLKENFDIVTKPVSDTVEPVATCDHPPCGTCGGSFFLRTGTCHVCQTCGTSQGCS